LENLIQQPFEIIEVPGRGILPGIFEDGLDLAFEILSVDQDDRSHLGSISRGIHIKQNSGGPCGWPERVYLHNTCPL
jgi:hypothetical protein